MDYEKMSKSELVQLLRSRDSEYGNGDQNRAPGLGGDGITLDDFPFPIWRAGVDARCNYFNRAWLSFTGRPLESELGNGWVDNVHPDDIDHCLSDYQEAFFARCPFELEYRLRRHDGTYRWFLDAGRPLHGGDGTFAGYIGSCVDITERKIAEETLNAFIADSPVGQVIVDENFRCIRVNEALAQMSGIPVEAHYGKSVRDIEPRLYATLEKLFQRILDTRSPLLNVEISGETSMQPGVERHWLTSHFPIFGSDGRPVYIGGTVVDITDRRRAEDALLSYQERLKSLAEESFFAEERERRRIAEELHDRIGQTLTLAKIRLVTLAEELTGRSAAGTLTGIVELIDGAIREIRSLTFRLSPPLLFEVGLEAAVEWFGEKLFSDHGLLVSIAGEHEPAVLSEESRILLFQAVRELLVNVVKHAGARHAQVVFERGGGVMRIRVEDDGRGFDTDQMLSSRNLRSGFGLFNVRQKVEYAGGDFIIDSAPGKGTKVTIRFPVTS